MATLYFRANYTTWTKNEASRGRSRVGISWVTGLTQTPGTKGMGAANEGLDILDGGTRKVSVS